VSGEELWTYVERLHFVVRDERSVLLVAEGRSLGCTGLVLSVWRLCGGADVSQGFGLGREVPLMHSRHLSVLG